MSVKKVIYVSAAVIGGPAILSNLGKINIDVDGLGLLILIIIGLVLVTAGHLRYGKVRVTTDRGEKVR